MAGAGSSYYLLKGYNGSEKNYTKAVVERKGIDIPPVEIPRSNGGTLSKMMPLVIYKGKVYLGSDTMVSPEKISSLLDLKIGRSSGGINEWNVQDKSSDELASIIGEQDTCTVKGYDDNFRIMSYTEIGGSSYGQFFDCLNGITVKSGRDVLGKLKIADNIESAKFIGIDDFNNGLDNYIDFNDLDILNGFSKKLNNSVPYSYETIADKIESSRNNDNCRQFYVKLKDGCEVRLNVFKDGYVSYGNLNLYFKVDNNIMEKLWQYSKYIGKNRYSMV